MTFMEKLTEYMEQIDINASQLAKASGNIDVSTINRYRSGVREPNPSGKQLKCLAKGINTLADEKGISLSGQDVFGSLYETLTDGILVDYNTYLANLNHLISVLDIKSSALAKAITYDPSHISKILSGQRRPGNMGTFTRKVSEYIARHCDSSIEIYVMAKLLHQETDAIQDPVARQAAIMKWLGTNIPTEIENMISQISRFLKKISAFSLDEFVQTIHLQDGQTSQKPCQIPSTKTYDGMDEMLQSDLDFIHATLLSDSMDDCILYNDMPLESAMEDERFSREWLSGMESLLDKGLQLHIIHNIDRPLSELLWEIENHLSLYLTGQVSAYYISVPIGNVFSHLLKVSGAAALEGSAIAGHHASGRYVLTTFCEDVAHYQKRATELLAKAQPLMDIYTVKNKERFWEYMHNIDREQDLQMVDCSFPLFTMDEELLESILKRSQVSEQTSQRIRQFHLECRSSAIHQLEAHHIALKTPWLTAKQFDVHAPSLALSELFLEEDILYSYEEYTAHLEQTHAFARQHPHFTLESIPMSVSYGIAYSIIANREVIISKNASPSIHFAIHHPKMVQAFLEKARDIIS